MLAQMSNVGRTNRDFSAWALLFVTLHQFALVFKHEKFRDEREWRVFSRVFPIEEPGYPLEFGESKSMLIPYRRVPLRDDRASSLFTKLSWDLAQIPFVAELPKEPASSRRNRQEISDPLP